MENKQTEIDITHHQGFALKSGERQVASTLDGIRYDHRCRYQTAADFLKEFAADRKLRILDCFCGNGYGTYLLAKNLPNATVEGIDGSDEAVALANESYKLPENSFSARIFPFELPRECYDAVVSLESIEHVEEDALFLKTLTAALKPGGFLFLTVPNENVIHFEKNSARYKFHFRHYRYEDILGMAHENELFLLAYWGQNYYRMSKEGQPAGDLPAGRTVPFKSHDGQALIFLFQKAPVDPRIASCRTEALIGELRSCHAERIRFRQLSERQKKEKESLQKRYEQKKAESLLRKEQRDKVQAQRDAAWEQRDALQQELNRLQEKLNILQANPVCRLGISIAKLKQKIK